MKTTSVYRSIDTVMKLIFSAVILQLLFIVLGAESGDYPPSAVIGMLEYCAAGCICTLGGGLFCRYILKNEDE